MEVLASNSWPPEWSKWADFSGSTTTCDTVKGLTPNAIVETTCQMSQSYNYVILRPRKCSTRPDQANYFHIPEVIIKSSGEVHEIRTSLTDIPELLDGGLHNISWFIGPNSA